MGFGNIILIIIKKHVQFTVHAFCHKNNERDSYDIEGEKFLE